MQEYFSTKIIDKVKNDTLLSNSFIYFVGSVLAGGGNYIFHFLMARMLTVEGYGELQSLLSLSVIVGIPTAALLTVLVKYTAHFKAKEQLDKIYNLFFLFSKKILLVAVVFFTTFLIFNGYIRDFLKLSSSLPVIILGIGFFPVLLKAVNSGIIQGLEKFKSISIITIIDVFAKILFAVLLVKLTLGINGVIGAIVLAGIISYFISFLPLKFLFKKEKEQIKTKEIFKYFLPVFFTLLCINSFYNIDIILVKHFFNPHMAGQYGALSLIGRIIIFVGAPLATVMFPATAKVYARQGKHYLIFKKSLLLTLGIGCLALLGYFIFPELIVKILVGAKFLPMVPYLGWFGLAMLLYSLVNILSRYLLSIDSLKYIYILFSGIVLQIVLIILWHNNLQQIVWIMNTAMAYILVALLIYYSRCSPRRVKKLLFGEK